MRRGGGAKAGRELPPHYPRPTLTLASAYKGNVLVYMLKGRGNRHMTSRRKTKVYCGTFIISIGQERVCRRVCVQTLISRPIGWFLSIGRLAGAM